MPSDLLSPSVTINRQRDIWSISRLNQDVKQLLNSTFGLLWLQGEVSNFSKPASGHYYFSMKDSLAQIRCAMFKGRNRYLDFSPENGMQILARGRLGLYETRGEYQFIVEHIEETGTGALQYQFEQHFEKFKQEGLFNEDRKKPIPNYPKHIGIITSGTGAALQDALDVLARRYPLAEVFIYPTPVQGEGAAQKIAQQIARANKDKRCDTLLLMRGGGSIEDLWAFNEEVVVRAIAVGSIPLVSGIGHEIDFTLADFAADRRAPTPSVAAELACPQQQDVMACFNHWQSELRRTANSHIAQQHSRLNSLRQRLAIQHPQRQLQQKFQRCDELSLRLSRAIDQHRRYADKTLSQLQLKLAMHSPKQHVTKQRNTLNQTVLALHSAMGQRITSLNAQLKDNMHALHIASPMATLERGYSITQREGATTPLTCIDGVVTGDRLSTQLTDGILTSVVDSTAPIPTPS